MNEILVTGGAGYIGSHTVAKLINRGYNIHIIDNFSNSFTSTIDSLEKLTKRRLKITNIDITDSKKLRDFMSQNKFDSVIHFAGLKSIPESLSNPFGYYENNVLGSLNLFNEMKNNNINKIIFSSSATVYDRNNISPVAETAPLESFSNAYGNSKRMIENILQSLSISNGWNVICLRYFNPVGAHKSGKIGENPKQKLNNLMPALAMSAIQRHKFKIFGDDYETKDGTCIRDFIHIDDLAEGHLKSLETIRELEGFYAINLGTGKGYSVKEIVRKFREVNKINVDYEIIKRRPGDVAESFADVSLAKKILKWEAKLDIDEMCTDAWNWYKEKTKNRF